jgi:hypothetical protein
VFISHKTGQDLFYVATTLPINVPDLNLDMSIIYSISIDELNDIFMYYLDNDERSLI